LINEIERKKFLSGSNFGENKIFKDMKTKMKSVILAAAAALFSVTVSAQEDTVRVVKETNVVRDTVRQTQVVHDTVVKENRRPERPPLRRGEFGVRYMPTFSSLAFRSANGQIIQGDVTMSNGFGVMAAINLSRHVGIQAEASYLDINQKYKDQNLNRQVEVSYLNIPIMLSLNTDKTRMVNWNFVAGPQFGINLGSSVQTTGDENTGTLRATVAAKGTDIGVAYGTGLEFALSRNHNLRFDLGYRGYYGLVDASANQTSTSPDTYNVLVRASRFSHAAYLGLTLCF
jgi:hypothetical protein